MKIHELGHVVLSVADLERSRRFYGEILGFTEVCRMGERGVMFSSGRTHHELLLLQGASDAAPLPEKRGLGLNHLALKIGTTDDELRAALDELQENEVRIDRIVDHGVTHSIYLWDPDGNRVEVFIDTQPELWRTDMSVVGGGGKPLAL
jgi:catechol 2,3-dioxygenase